MSKTFSVTLVAPGEPLQTFEAKFVRAPGTDGYFGVMAHRQPLIASLGLGLLRIHDVKDGDLWFGLTGGLFEMIHNQVTILADHLMKPEDIPDSLRKSVGRIFFPSGAMTSLAQIDLAQALLARKLNQTSALPRPQVVQGSS